MRKLFFTSIFFTLLGSVSSAISADVDWEAGGKHGWVLQVYDDKSAENQLPECLKKLNSSERENRYFVKIHYRHVKKFYTTIAEIPKDMDLKIDEEVEVFPANCDLGKFAKITKSLLKKH
ncbi:hypothetical protein LPB67_17020 [Undibacterium sp. Jales W-56]|uniref:hypothetical protein n=1 Tax=Undibacterium sp. Jales W-56 TaxID=2897325 RepID=UPI0021D0BB40|nr:hypothetical protein [Undibacterium sp. Jales W-56]MCU6435481.1 hypothetical protein [Undibacterium sp. Jales W-56]